MRYPATLVEAIRYFYDQEKCVEYMSALLWPTGEITCPTCGRMDVSYLKSQQRFQCKSRHPKRQFSVKVGTIFEDSPLGLD